MLKKLGFNGIKRLQFISSTLVVFAYLLEMLASDALPNDLLHRIASITLLPYIFATALYAFSVGAMKDRTGVVIDELSKQNEAKASQISYSIVAIALFLGVLFNQLTGKDVSLGYKALFCLVIGLSALKDGIYLLLERSGGRKNAGTDD